jgi:hypothetical protein
MPRTRSFLFDSGILYVNVDVVSNANSITTAAGSTASKKIKTVEIKPYASVVQVVTGTNEWYLNNNIVITNILSTLRGPSNFAPQGRDMIVVLRKKHASNGNTTTFQTITITKATTSKTVDTSLTALAGDRIYFDVTQVGSTIPGQGLKLDITYY